LTRRSWAEYGVSSAEWQTNLAIGMKACLVRAIPIVPIALGWGSSVEAVGWVIAVVLMVWIMNRQKPVRSGRGNLIVTVSLLVLPILVALAMGSLSVVIASTVVWQFFLSGFGEEFAYRGYTQSRLNQAFGRPAHLFGIQFGPGLVIASLLFGLLHAFNSFRPALGFSSLGWGSAIASFVAGLFFGVLREKTGTLVAPGIAHGLLDAVGEPLRKVFGI
ncbi:MAG: CPBP family intramembrane metalloprotease, partial [Chloroflexi bacterium]